MNRYFSFLILVASSWPLWAQGDLTTAQIQSLDSIATADIPPGAPGVATAVLRDGQVLYQKWAGYADLSDSSLITADTRFNYCSNAKQFTALALLLLAEQGKLSLDQDLRDFFPQLYPDVEQPLTLRHLLTHRSGIRDVYDLMSLQGKTWWKYAYTNQDALDLLAQQQELNFPPGSQYLYSNSNYLLLAEVVAQASGQSFVAYTDEMFERLGMEQTGFLDAAEELEGNIARPYFNFDTWTTYDWIWEATGDGNLFTSLHDQLTWERWVQAPETAPISPQVIRESQSLISLSQADNYGYGLEYGTFRGRPCRFHEGATGAWKATFLRFPEQRLALVTLINTGKTSSDFLTRKMAEVVLELPSDEQAYATAPTQEGPLLKTEKLPGTYLLDGRFSFQVEATDRPDELLLKRFGRNDTRLVRESTNVFHQWNDPDFKQEFARNQQGELTLTAYHWSHAPYTLTRQEVDWSGFSPSQLVGRYYNAETEVYLAIEHQEGQRYQVTRAKRASTGLLVSSQKMLVDSYALDFEGQTGPVPTIFLQGDRIRAVRFERVE